jgi:hypothetical protein
MTRNLFLFLLSVSTTAAFVVPVGRVPRTVAFVSTPLPVSDDVDADVHGAEQSAEDIVQEAGEALYQSEQQDDAKKSLQRERHTLFVGNLAFGKASLSSYNCNSLPSAIRILQLTLHS